MNIGSGERGAPSPLYAPFAVGNPTTVCTREHQKDAANVGQFVFRTCLGEKATPVLKRLGNGIAETDGVHLFRTTVGLLQAPPVSRSCAPRTRSASA